MVKILITGGSGLVGKRLSKKLIEKGYDVLILTRNKKNKSATTLFWDYTKRQIDSEAITETDFIIHLAGANVGTKRWTSKRKQEIIESRVASANFLFEEIKKCNLSLKGYISASATGYYGALNSEEIFTEDSQNANDFLATTCNLWEKSAEQFKSLGIRAVVLRTGVVFSEKGGALEKIIKPIRLGFGAVLATGKQYIPWIHIDDLCDMYIQAIENPGMEGVFNAVATEHISNKDLTHKIAQLINKKIFLPNIPSFMFRIMFGKMSSIILKGSRVSSEKIAKQGFTFNYPTIDLALKSLIKDEK